MVFSALLSQTATASTSQTPWWLAALITVVTSVLTYLATRRASTDKVKSDMLAQAIERQKQLDERQTKLMDDLNEDIGRLRDELILVRRELDAERTGNKTLRDQMDTLKEENRTLKAENRTLKAQVAELKKTLSNFTSQDNKNDRGRNETDGTSNQETDTQ